MKYIIVAMLVFVPIVCFAEDQHIASERAKLEIELDYFEGDCYAENSSEYCTKGQNLIVDLIYELEDNPEEYFKDRLTEQRRQQRRRNQTKPITGIKDPYTGKVYPVVRED